MTRRFRRVQVSAAVAATVVAGIVAFGVFRPTAAAQTNSRPNVIVILVDDMGWSDVGPYGS